ncbi:DNA-binding protein [Bacillus thuringiensis]|nr:DNA-binding protein [Bacillus thuringiensis]PEW91921.1 DNA-binding protein [Bacillus thuringiensis]PGP53363.1 DNA-binding protein [Bacillus thuringiensis]
MVLSYIIGVNEASLITGLSTGYIKNLCAEGKIPAKKIGKTWIIDKRDIEKKG